MKFTRYEIATAIAILFHAIGLAGILLFDRTLFVRATSINLLLMFFLLLYTQRNINRSFILFVVCCFVTGMIAELIGTRTGWLFGKYEYGNVLGPGIYNVPFMIGINWFIIIYCCGIFIHTLLTKILTQLSIQTGKPQAALKLGSILVDGSMLAVLFDWIMEPVAVKLGYWTWAGFSGIPLYNYISWFIVSSVLMVAFHFFQFNKQNKFAVNLLLIQMMFFLVLRTLL